MRARRAKQNLPWAENVSVFTQLLFTGSFGPALAKCPALCMDSWYYSEGVTREQHYRNVKPLYRLSERQLEILEKALDFHAGDLGAISSSATSWLYDFIPWTSLNLSISPYL